ncbi:MAG: DUF4476 domain-containing protein [Chitinophagaceae bacterium]|nr:MAG: DUF4476 domain-containing protein [Chitinophagaceae bacterium]
MKRSILLLTIFSLLSLSSFAYHNTSTFSFRMDNNENVFIILGNYHYGPASSFEFDIQAGRYNLKVERRFNTYFGYTTHVLYNGHINIRNNMHVFASLNHFNRLNISEKVKNYTPHWGNPSAGYNTCPSAGAVTQTVYYEYSHHHPVVQPMNSQSFNNLLATIRNQSFDSSKRQVAKQVISNNYFSTSQAKAIIRLFTFESSKLEIAKYIYNNTIDKENYFTVYDEFTFSSSVRELSRYISQY